MKEKIDNVINKEFEEIEFTFIKFETRYGRYGRYGGTI